MLLTSLVGYVRRNGKPFPLSTLKTGETFNNWNGEHQEIANRFTEGAGVEIAAVRRLEGVERGAVWYCYDPRNPICYAESPKIARRWEARLTRARRRSLLSPS